MAHRSHHAPRDGFPHAEREGYDARRRVVHRPPFADLCLRITLAAAFAGSFCGSDWPRFRGPEGTGSAAEGGVPTDFGDDGAPKHVAWKVPLPGRGPSSPIVVGDLVAVTASSGPREKQLHVLAFDAQTGKPRWHRRLWATGHTVCHNFGAVATPTPASDGKRIFAFYSSNDLACFDLDGNLRWFRGLAYENPGARNDVGMGSSPVVVGGTVVVQVENQGTSFAAGIDAATGEARWRHERQTEAVWSSPAVIDGGASGKDVVLMQSRDKLTAHDAHSGEHLWDYEASCNTMASACHRNGIIYLPSHGLFALKPVADRGGVEVLWHEPRLRSSAASPVVHEGRVYAVKPPAILVCGDANSGEILWQLRLKGRCWATPVAADDHLFAVNHDGLVHVVRLGEEGELVGRFQIDKAILASPAVADGAVYFRSDEHLWKIAGK